MKKVFLRKILLVIFGISFILSSFNVGKILAAEPTFELSNAVIESKSDGVDASIESFSNNKLITDTAFHKVDDYVKYKLTIKNTSKTKYKLVLLDDNNNNDNVTYEYNYDKDEYILENDTMDVLLIVTYKKGITQINQRTQDQEVKILFYLEDEEGNTYEETITNNPKTNDNILIYIITAITSLILIVLIVFRKKLSKLFAFLLLIVPIAINALSPSLIIVLRNNTNLLDKMVVYSDVDGESQAVLVDYNTAYERPKDPEKTGYVFDNWYIGDQVYNFDEPLTDDINLIAKFNIINYNINYELDDGIVSDNPSTYNVETETFTLNNPTKEGYVFLGWSENDSSDLSTKVTINKGSTGDKTFKAHFEAGDATPYTVKHKYKKLDGTYDEEVENLVGVTDSEITVAIKHKYGFVDPTLKSLKITSDGQSYIEYEYEREEYELTLENSENIDSTFTSGKYLYETEISLTAKTLDNYNFVKWSNNETSKNIKFNITEDTTLGPIYQVKQYTVSFDGQGGSTPEDIIKDYNSSIGTLPTSEKENYIFDGWYTEATGGTKINSDTKVSGDVTYYAHWLKSIALATITPTNININKGQSATINVSNADEEYTFTSNDEDIASIDENGNVLAVGKGTTTITIKGTVSNKTREINVTVNLIMYTISFDSHGGSSVEDIKKEKDTELGTLPTSEKENYIFDGWYTSETGGTKITSSTKATGTVTYHAHWLKSVALATVSPESITITRGQTTTITVTDTEEEYTFTSNDEGVVTVDENGVVTSVAKGTTTITIKGTVSNKTKTVNVTVNPIMYTISFNAHGGSSVEDTEKEENTKLGTLPTTEKENYIFDGWYTSETGGEKITSNTDVTGTVTYHAHWLKSVALADITPTSININKGQSAVINVSNVEEEYTFTSNDENVVTVDENGVVTSVAKGTTTITVKGTVSNKTRDINVTVNPIIYTISFDSHGGSSVEDIEREEDTTLGTLPTSEKENYVLDGWYTSETGGTKITSSTKATGTVTYHAHWLKSIALATISPESITLDKPQTTTIEVTNVEEPYSFTSNNQGVVSVDENGLVTSVGKGTTTITITGELSGGTKTVNVIVNAQKFAVGFDSQGGSSVDSIEKEEDEELGTLPTTERENYIFDGWYTAATGGDKITETTTVTGSVTYYAHWLKSVALATISPESITLTRGETTTITVTNVDEEYTITSGRTAIATVENNVVTAVAKGTTILTIRGTVSNKTKTVNVTVNPIMYTISFDSQGGTEVEDIEREENTSIGTLPTTEKENYIFNGWYTAASGGNRIYSQTGVSGTTTYYAHWLKSIALADITPTSISINNGQSAKINVSNVDESYTFTSNDEDVATVDENGIVSSVGMGTTTITIRGTVSNKIKEVNVTVNAQKFVISFDSQGGTEVEDIEREENAAIGTLPTSEKENYIFDGWYTSATGGDKVTETTKVTGPVTYYAHWLKSVALATVTPESITLTRGETATISVTDVDEEYTITSNKVGIATVENNVVTAVSKGSATLTVRGTVSNKTKTVDVTVNPIMYTISFNSHGGAEVADIKREENTAIGTLPTIEKENYIFDGWYTSETGGTKVSSSTTAAGNVTYHAHWLNSVALATVSPASITLTRGETTTITVTGVDEEYTLTSNNERIATIENNVVTGVAKGTTTISINGAVSNKTKAVNTTINPIMYTISFDSQGGTEVEDIEGEENTAIGALPTSEKENYIFDGWYTAPTGGTKIYNQTDVTGTTTYYAHWLKSVALATITPESISLTIGQTTTISVTGVDEEYTITSNNEEVATVANNVVTAVAKGTTTLTVRGTVSNKTKTVDVTVNPIMYTISFNSHGGTEVEDIEKEENAAIGTLPATEKENYIFDGWYTSENGGTKITSSTIVEGTVTYHAHWLKSVALATITPESISLIIGQTTTISVTGAEEEYTITSNNGEVATVENNVVTAVAKGTTTLTVRGVVSNKTKTVNVTITTGAHTVTFDPRGGSSVEDIEVEDDAAIGTLPTSEKENYELIGWYTSATGGTKITSSTKITDDVTYYAHWNQVDLDLTKVFYIPGSCTFNGSPTASQVGNITSDSPQGCVSTINPSGNDIDYTDVKYIDSHISLFSSDNFEKDFELGFNLDEFITDSTADKQGTIVNSKLENSTEKYPGFVVRKNSSTAKVEIAEKFGTDTNYGELFTYQSGMNIRVSRQDGVMFYSINGGKWVSLQDIKSYAKRFNLTTWFGAMSKETSMTSTGEGSDAGRYFKGKISDVYIKLETGSATKHTVTFDTKGGTAVFTTKQVKDGNKIYGLPSVTKTNMELEGWYTDETYATKVTEDTIINEDVTFVAKWKGLNAIARVDDTEFVSIQDAIDSTRGSGTKKEITILNDLTITEKLIIHEDNNVEFDLQDYTFTSTNVAIFENYGTLTIKNGTLINNGKEPRYSINNTSTGVVYITGGTIRATSSNAIANVGRMEISGGNIIGTADAAPINNNTDGILIVSGGSIVATNTNKGQAIYNDGGTVTIMDDAYLENNSTNRAALHNNVGTVNILGGTIIAKNYSAALNSDTMIIGDNSDPINITSPVLQGKTYGLEIASGKTVTVYDGIFKGITSAINDLSKVTHNTNVDFNTTNTETIGGNTYNVAYLEEQ